MKESILKIYGKGAHVPEKLLDYIIKDENQAAKDFEMFKDFCLKMEELKDEIEDTKNYKLLKKILPRGIEHYYQFRKEDVEEIEEGEVKLYQEAVRKYEEYINNDLGQKIKGPWNEIMIKNEFEFKAMMASNSKEENITYLYNLYHFHIKPNLKTKTIDTKNYDKYIEEIVSAYIETKVSIMWDIIDRVFKEYKEFYSENKEIEGGYYGYLLTYYKFKRERNEISEERFEEIRNKIKYTTMPSHMLIYFMLIKDNENITKEEKRKFVKAHIYRKNTLKYHGILFNFIKHY